MKLLPVQKMIRAHASAERAAVSRRFFKTGVGEYAEGDVFCGVRVPDLRRVAREFRDMSYGDVVTLLHSPVHEDRLVALYIMVFQYTHALPKERRRYVQLYTRSIRAYINNWDLVDTSAEHIIGEYVYSSGDHALLRTLAHSTSLWERRVAIVATFYMIKNNQSEPTLTIARILLNDEHDLIHKATGWMLRELGKHERERELRDFLNEYKHVMPRTMLRYAIERFSAHDRQVYLKR